MEGNFESKMTKEKPQLLSCCKAVVGHLKSKRKNASITEFFFIVEII